MRITSTIGMLASSVTRLPRRSFMLMATAAAVGVFPTLSMAADEISIAVVGPMSGQYASFGEQLKAGAEMATEDINAAGGINGKQVKLILSDDACDPKQAVAVAGKLVSEKVDVVIGHFCSGSSIPASKVYAEEGVLMIGPASTNPKLTDERAGPNVFRISGRDDQQGEVIGKYLAEKFKDQPIALVNDKSTYGKGLTDQIKLTLNAAGVNEAVNETLTAGEKDYSSLVTVLRDAKVAAVAFGGYHPEGGLLVRQMREQGMNSVFIGGDGLVTSEFWQITGKAGEGALMTFTPDPRKNVQAKDVVARFRAKNQEPEGYILYTYAAIQTYAQAAANAKSVDEKEVEKALVAGEFDTVAGKFKFNDKGDPTLRPWEIYVWKDGKYEQMN